MNSQRIRYLTAVSLGLHLLLVGACGILIYQASPLRDPAFQPNSANAGSSVFWLQGVTETDLLIGSTILAALLAINFTLFIWQRSQKRSPHSAASRSSRNRRIWRTLSVGAWVGLSSLFFIGFWLVFLIYLSQQWLLD